MIIKKVIANRVKGILSYLISDEQFVFLLKIGEYITLSIMLLLTKNQSHQMHEYQDIGKMAIGDDGYLLQNHALD